MSRTNANFSKHELFIIENEHFNSFHLKKPNTVHQNVKFTNIDNVCLVTGDLGNWVFCRPFKPSPDGSVSDHYWLEKLGIHSTQEGTEFDAQATEKIIKKGLRGGLKQYGYSGDRLNTVKEYYKELLNHVNYSEWEYTSYAYTNKPSVLDAEEVPFAKKTTPFLMFVFDAFDEICKRLKK